MGDVVIGTPNGQMPVYLATPSGAGPWPGVVVIHDFAGMSHDLQTQADWLASEGYLAAAPDLYYWGSRLRCLWTIMREVTAGTGRTVADIDAVRDWLSARAAARLERALTALGVDHDIKVYPGASHGFINDHDPADMTLLLIVLNKLSGTRYHAPSARDAHRRIAAFFRHHLAA